MTTQPSLAATIDRDIYLITQLCRPALVAAVAELISAGQTPAQVEQAFVAKYGVSQTTRNIRSCAEYIAAQYGTQQQDNTRKDVACHASIFTI